MDTLAIPVRDYLYLEGLTWDDYETFLEELGERPIRVTYDSGRMEVMTLSFEHESQRTLLGRFIGAVAIVLNIPMCSGGMTTMKQALIEKGLEPDDSYWIRHEKRMRRKKRLDLDTDPPPDIVTEVEVSRSMLNRMRIYAALRVPELWRVRKGKLTVYLLGKDGKYHPSDRSAAFPLLPIAGVQRFLDLAGEVDETTLVRRFMDWIANEVQPLVDSSKPGKPRKNGRGGNGRVTAP